MVYTIDMAIEKLKIHAYRITDKQHLKIKKKSVRHKVSQSQIIRNLVDNNL